MGEPERLEHQRGNGAIEGLSRDLLQDPPRQVVAGLAVGGAGPGECDQVQLRKSFHIASKGVIAFSGVDDETPVHARSVVEQVQDSYFRRGALILERQLGDVPANRGLQFDLALGD